MRDFRLAVLHMRYDDIIVLAKRLGGLARLGCDFAARAIA
jgi:hypothetical protein